MISVRFNPSFSFWFGMCTFPGWCTRFRSASSKDFIKKTL